MAERCSRKTEATDQQWLGDAERICAADDAALRISLEQLAPSLGDAEQVQGSAHASEAKPLFDAHSHLHLVPTPTAICGTNQLSSIQLLG